MWAETVCPVSAISNFSVIFILFFLKFFLYFCTSKSVKCRNRYYLGIVVILDFLSHFFCGIGDQLTSM